MTVTVHPLSFVSRIYVSLNYAAMLLLMPLVVVLGVLELVKQHHTVVSDETACDGYTFQDRPRPDYSLSLVDFVLNGSLAASYAICAVRYENGGFLVVQVVVVLLQLSRAAYFLRFVVPNYLNDNIPSLFYNDGPHIRGGGAALHSVLQLPHVAALRAATYWILGGSMVLWMISSLLSQRVHRSFGWRRYSRGLTHVALLAVRRRRMYLQTCLQLDAVVTLNASLATLLLLDDAGQRLFLLLITIGVLYFHRVMLPLLQGRRQWRLLLVAAVFLLLSLGYYSRVSSSRLYLDQHLRKMDDAPRCSPCYYNQLQSCLASDSIFIVADDGVAAAAPPPAVDKSGGGSGSRERMSRGYQGRRVQMAGERDGGGGGDRPPKSFASRFLRRQLHHEALNSRPDRDDKGDGNDAAETVSRLVRVVNGTHTYLPTRSASGEYFMVSNCNRTCFDEAEKRHARRFTRRIEGCCASYGRCRLKDAYRLYALALLLLLIVFAFVVRVVLLMVAAYRLSEGDDAVIASFVAHHRQLEQLSC